MNLIPLRAAVELYKKEPNTPINSYQWYRKNAQSHGGIHFGDTNINVKKINRKWFVDSADVKMAIDAHRDKEKKISETTKDFRKGIIRGEDGGSILIEGGHYEIHGSFRFVVSDIERARHKSDGTWYCNKCKRPATTKHEKQECHLCSDWNGCGRDCTLSEIICKNCGTYRKI